VRAPVIVAAPIDGVIDRIEVVPSAPVGVGDVLVRLTDTVLRNRLHVARQEMGVAEARGGRPAFAPSTT
jgi:multidrug resistance efflux pump